MIHWRFWRWGPSNQIIGGFALGLVAGLMANLSFGDNPRLLWALDQIFAPIGEVFLRIIFMIIIPLILSAFILGIAGLGTMQRLKSMGLRYLIVTLALAMTLVGAAQLLVIAISPGSYLSDGQRKALTAKYGIEVQDDVAIAREFPGVAPALVNLIPDNPVRHLARALTVDDDGAGLPAILIFSLFVSLAILVGPDKQMEVLKSFFRGLFAVSMNIISFALKLAPICIMFLAFDFGARLGLELMASMSMYLATFTLVILFAFGIVFPSALMLFARRSPWGFYKAIKEPFWFAAATTSSSATFPLALRAAKNELRIPDSISQFVLTLGAVANQVGSSIFVAVSTVFLAEIFGVQLGLLEQVQIFALSVAFTYATPGVPGGNLPLLASFCLLFGIPPTAVAIVVSVDRVMDMGVTSVNVVGDLVVSSVLARSEKPSQVTEEAI